jgi:tRNA A-37 threonylcarbamoyl transferase component Bud32
MGAEARDAVVYPGDVIDGRYRVIEVVGEGGMGTVYLAEHALIKRRVAIKILRPDLASDGNVIKRFMNEARAAGTLGHPNIVESTDMGFIDRTVPYIVFEYLEGSLLTDEIARLGNLPVRRAVKITRQIASALGAAHHAGIVHRDLKSDNIFLTDRGEMLDHVKVLDFGISKFLEAGDDRTRRGMVMGTPEFMAPEQITCPDSVDVRSDVYALGATLYEMLAGRRAFSNDDPRTLLHRIVHSDAPAIDRADLPRGLHDLVFKMMAKRPDDRLQDMTDVEAVLDLYSTQSDAAPRAAGRSRRTPAALEDTAPQTAVAVSRVVPRDTPLSFDAVKTPWPAAEPGTLTTVPAAPPPGRSPLRYAAFTVAAAGLVLGGAWLGPRLSGAPGADRAAPPAAPPPTIVTMPGAAALPAPAARPIIDLAVEADAPGARVVFRRRLSPAPFKTSVPASDIVELVEVDAPGHKTVRYWLTIDRPTALRARLPIGTGMVEATEAEILVALGEAAPEPPAEAAAPPAGAAQPTAAVAAARGKKPPVKVAATARPAPRRIGKSAASADPAPPDAGADTAGVTSATLADEPAPLLTADLSSLGDGQAAARPTVRPDHISPAVVARVMAKFRPQVVACRDNANAARSGAVTVGMTVDPSGAVSRPQVTSSTDDPEMVGCILKAASAWRFPKRGAGAEPAQVSHKFALR